MARIIKRICPDCGHVHRLNSKPIDQRAIEMACRNCGADFVSDHVPPRADRGIAKQQKQQDGRRLEGNESTSVENTPSRELGVTWGLVLRIYWAWLWRTVLFTILFGIIFGLPLGFAASILNLMDIQPLFTAYGVVVIVIVGLFTLRKVLKNDYRGFHLAFIRDP